MSAAEQEKDRRRFRRLSFSAHVRYAPRQYGSDTPPDLWEGSLVNISRSGAAIKVLHRLRRGGVLEISFIKNNPLRCVSVIGKVIRCEPMSGLHSFSPDGTSRPCHFVAIEFSRLMDVEEIAMLRDAQALDATVAEKSKGAAARPAPTA